MHPNPTCQHCHCPCPEQLPIASIRLKNINELIHVTFVNSKISALFPSHAMIQSLLHFKRIWNNSALLKRKKTTTCSLELQVRHQRDLWSSRTKKNVEKWHLICRNKYTHTRLIKGRLLSFCSFSHQSALRCSCQPVCGAAHSTAPLQGAPSPRDCTRAHKRCSLHALFAMRNIPTEPVYLFPTQHPKSVRSKNDQAL